MTATIQERLQRIEQLLTLSSKNVYNTEEAALFLGLSESRLRCLASQKELPHYKQRRRLYFAKEDLEQWLRSKRVKSNEEIDNEAALYILRKRRKS